MTTYTTTKAQAEALAAHWNTVAKEDAHINASQAHLLLGDNADADLAAHGEHLVEVPAHQSKTGMALSFYIDVNDVTAA